MSEKENWDTVPYLLIPDDQSLSTDLSSVGSRVKWEAEESIPAATISSDINLSDEKSILGATLLLSNEAIEEDEAYATEEMKSAKYCKANLEEYVQNQPQLELNQKAKLLTVLKKHEGLFQGKRGEWKGNKVVVSLVKDTNPCWARPYPIPLKNKQIVKNKVYRQCDIGALRELSLDIIKDQDWDFPAFGVPKKDGTIRLVIDSRQLNSQLARKQYPLLTIDELLHIT